MDSKELKPCPFCGGDAKLAAPGFHNSSIVCENYCAEAMSSTVWNRRVPDFDSLTAKLAAAEAATADACAREVEAMLDIVLASMAKNNSPLTAERIVAYQIAIGRIREYAARTALHSIRGEK